jgi:hypothetical protein
MTPDKLKQISESAFDHAAKKLELKEKVETQLYVVHNGGLFKATPELMTFLNTRWYHDTDEMVIEDSYSNPIKIDRSVLLDELVKAYKFAMNSWLVEYEELQQIRTGKNV